MDNSDYVQDDEELYDHALVFIIAHDENALKTYMQPVLTGKK